MKQDIKNISYNIKRDTEDKNLIYTIDYLLYNEIQDRFKTMESNKSVDAMYYEVLEDKDGIVDYVMQEVLKDYFEIDSLKVNYLVDKEFIKVAYSVKRYYTEANKSRRLKKNEELRLLLRAYFGDCFYNCDETDAEGILRAMSTQTYKDAALKDLNININDSDCKDFDKIYKQELSDFKRLHKDEVLESTKKQKKGGGIGFGWKLYAVVKVIETLFKL